MASLLRLLRSLDIFGEAVSLNYKGDSAYKTLPGAAFSVVLQVFLLVYTLLGLLDLLAYRNPQIVQVSLKRIR